jgi:hypothetical protein
MKGDFTQTMKRAVRMETVPPERWTRILVRTIVGAVVALAGIGILYGVVRSYIADPAAMSLWLLGTGVGLFGVGTHMVSGQLFAGSVSAVFGLARKARRVLPARRESVETPVPPEGE